MSEIELFFETYQHSFSGLAAIGTLAAVIISLWLSLQASRTNLIASIAVEVIVHDTIDPANRPTFLTVHLINKGTLAVRIPFSVFRWQIPFSRRALIVNPLDAYAGHQWVPRVQYPIIIEPKASHTIMLTEVEVFRREMTRAVGQLSPLWRFLFRFLRGVVYTQDATVCRVRITRSVREELRKLASA